VSCGGCGPSRLLGWSRLLLFRSAALLCRARACEETASRFLRITPIIYRFWVSKLELKLALKLELKLEPKLELEDSPLW
jgi:hypothetical protein